MKEGNENADLEHVHEFFVESFVRHALIVHVFIIKNLYFVLLD